MIKIVGVDGATSTGLCFMTCGTPPSKWRCVALEAEGNEHEEVASDLALMLCRQFETERPNFAVIERPERAVRQYGRKGEDLAGERSGYAVNAHTALLLNQVAGAAVATCDLMGIGWGLIAPATWRRAYFGPGRKPDGKWDRKNGEKPQGWMADWKDMAIHAAHLQRIILPGIKKADRDAAEAAGIACAWRKCTFIPARHQRAFMAFSSGRLPEPSLPTNEVA